MKKIILATGNQGKLREIQHLLINSNITILPQTELNISDVAETGLTFVENALIKARHATNVADLPAIADDSGLVVDVLDGEPGIYSARYAGSNTNDLKNMNKLLMQLSKYPAAKRQAHFYCVLVYLRHPQDPAPIICEGRWDGEILFSPQGEHGFGYDPVFYVPTHQCSAAQLSLDEKSKISHRGQALKKLAEALK